MLKRPREPCRQEGAAAYKRETLVSLLCGREASLSLLPGFSSEHLGDQVPLEHRWPRLVGSSVEGPLAVPDAPWGYQLAVALAELKERRGWDHSAGWLAPELDHPRGLLGSRGSSELSPRRMNPTESLLICFQTPLGQAAGRWTHLFPSRFLNP